MFNKNAINWFEIPVTDLERAQKFYETIFEMKMTVMDLPQIKMRLFPLDDPAGIGGSLVYAPDFYIPSETGTLLYLNGNPDLQKVLDNVEQAGGTILTPKRQIAPEIGFMAIFKDTEGNRVALHSGPVQ